MKSAATIYWLYCVLNSIYGKNAKITRDPLGKTYDVNKYGLRVTVNGRTNSQVIGDLMTYLKQNSYEEQNWHQLIRQDETTITHISMSDYGNYVYLHVLTYKVKKVNNPESAVTL